VASRPSSSLSNPMKETCGYLGVSGSAPQSCAAYQDLLDLNSSRLIPMECDHSGLIYDTSATAATSVTTDYGLTCDYEYQESRRRTSDQSVMFNSQLCLTKKFACDLRAN
jgi:hypothetical protein